MVDVLKIVAIIAGIIVLVRLKVALSINLIVSAFILAFLFRLPAGEIIDGVRRTFLSLENLKLVIALELVLLFSAVLKENGAMSRAISALSGVVRDARFTVAIIPAGGKGRRDGRRGVRPRTAAAAAAAAPSVVMVFFMMRGTSGFAARQDREGWHGYR